MIEIPALLVDIDIGSSTDIPNSIFASILIVPPCDTTTTDLSSLCLNRTSEINWVSLWIRLSIFSDISILISSSQFSLVNLLIPLSSDPTTNAYLLIHNKKNISLNIAKEITDIPLIYYPWGLQAAAIRFKNSLQENTKIHAISEDIIEACHNGIVAWERESNVKPILIQGQDDHLKTKERYEIFKEYFELNKIKFKEVHSVPGNILSKIINLIYFLDYTTIYRAVLLNIDPSPVKSIDFIKNKIEQCTK